MKKIFLFVWMGLCAVAGVQAQEQHDGLPGVPQTEAYVVTPVDTTSGVTVRKVSFLRSNQIVLVGNLFLPKNFDGSQRYLWGIERSGFFNGRGKWAKGFENQRV